MGCKKQTVNLQESICKGAIEHGNIVICNCHGNMPGICKLWGFEGEDGLYGTLSVLHRRMPQSDLQKLLEVFNEVFSKKDGLSVADLKEAAVCYVKMKVLLEHEEDNFSPYSTRDLIKEYKTQKTKIANIIRLSEMNAMTAEEYAKERIEQTLEKNRAVILNRSEDEFSFDCDLSNMKELMDKFDNRKWADLSEDDRMALVEQVVSKIADILGLNEIPEVMYFEDDPSNCGYYYSGWKS